MDDTGIEPAKIEWRDGAPQAPRFGDSYFSRDGGLDEARGVFLAGCGLPDRWADRTVFRIGELGFGSGLNILALWDLWRRARPSGARLSVASVEGFPMPRADAARTHACFPEVADLSARLLAQWPAPAAGAHFLHFPEDGFALTVFHGQAAAALSEMEGAFDAWFLDGFSPARNPDMWSPAVMARVAALSAPGARAATFTVAGAVRSALAEAGFAVSKRPGFGRKRERLEAVLERPLAADAAPDPLPRGRPVDGPVLILGGGIAGCAVAHALRARGREVTIVSSGPAASALPRALLTPRIEAADRPHARALHAAYLHAARLYGALDGFAARGGMRLAKDAAEAARLAAAAALWPGLDWQAEDGAHGALGFEGGGVLDPARILPALAGGAARIDARVNNIRREGDVWRLLAADGAEIASAPVLVLAGGAGGAGLDPLATLGLEYSGGQVSLHAAAGAPRLLTGAGGFAAPVGEDGMAIIGATHDRLDAPDPPSPDGGRASALAEAAAARDPGAGLEIRPREIWTGVRAATKDRLPCAGALPDPDGYRRAFAQAAKGGSAIGAAEGAFAPGLFTLTGLGSRGFAHAPLLAEAVAVEICGEAAVLEASARRALHPARFAWRALKRA